MPSEFESLSMVALEAWALGRPVLANGRCDVLRGQCVRSNGGLYYENFEEFAEALFTLEATGPLGAVLGASGRDFFTRNYTWPVIERKYLDMIERLKKEPSSAAAEPLPGFFARRKRTLPPGLEVMKAAPAGPVLRP
jgi:glycosyltransferase involved in cell wall biosynthesis